MPMMNSQQNQFRKAPFIYPEYLSQMTSKIKPKKSEGPILSAMSNGLFPSQGLGDTTNIDELKQAPSSATSTTAGETANSHLLPPPITQYPRRDSHITAASDPLPAQPMLYSSTNPMNRGLFMNQRMPNFNMSHAFSGGFSNLFSKNPFQQSPEEQQASQKDDQSMASTTSSTRRTLFPGSPIMLIPTSSSSSSAAAAQSKGSLSSSPPKQGSVAPSMSRTPKRAQSPTLSPKKAPPISPKMQPSSAPPSPPPQSPFRSLSKALRITAAGTMVTGNSNNTNTDPTSEVTIVSSSQSVASTVSQFSIASQVSSSVVKAGVRDPPKIRVKLQHHQSSSKTTQGLSPKRKCASCVCRDQKLVDQRKEIDHLKDVIQDLLVLGMESRASMQHDDDDDDDSLEDLPLPFILEEQRAPHRGDLIKAAEMALSPTRQAFEVDPQDPLKKEAVSSTTAVLQMSHSLQIKRAFQRRSPHKIPEKIRHLRIQVNGDWGYYSGPTPEADKQLIGCVVRFDNGDLYLGNMENSCFHGPGTYYPKGGRPLRGNFECNQLLEYEC